MKFARYLEETQASSQTFDPIGTKNTPLTSVIPDTRMEEEIHKLIKAIETERATNNTSKTSLKSKSSPQAHLKTSIRDQITADSPTAHIKPPEASGIERSPGSSSPLNGRTPHAHPHYGSNGQTPKLGSKRSPSVRMILPSAHEDDEEPFSLPPPAQPLDDHDDDCGEVTPTVIKSSTANIGQSRPNLFSRINLRQSKGTVANQSPRIAFNSYASVLAAIGPKERKFFDYLDAEIDKAEQFYDERSHEAVVRLVALKEQFKELAEHRSLYHASLTTQGWSWKVMPYVPRLPVQALEDTVTSLKRGHTAPELEGEDVVVEAATAVHPLPFSRDPETYHSAKKNLKHAILEYYHFLELLKNYQTLNVTAIRKSTKKFEKATKLSIHVVYNRDRVDGLHISSENEVKRMIENVEELYASRFEGGDKKKARDRLKMLGLNKTHHWSTFRSGIHLGLAIPALVVGIYNVCKREKRAQLHVWGSLLEAYATLAIPTIFSLLIGLNMLAWSRKRLNYVFIFELDLRSTMDPRVYFEIPSFLCMTLAYAFMLSFCGVFDHHANPTIWPAAWLGIFVLLLFNPLPIIYHKSRFWLIGNWCKLLLPGLTPVEFADFWMGDQLCSMVYTLGHLYFLGCLYATDWEDPMIQCSLTNNWIAGILITSMPSFIRLIQCIKRYADSHNYIHLINCGKYSSSILQYAFYYNWRAHGSPHGWHLTIWILSAIFSSTYTSSWDLSMDWSLLQKGSAWPLLRKELVYEDHVYVYYIAMISDILIRFVWIIYLPAGPAFNQTARSIVAGSLEMLRRVQWNFFRVENEHLGNADQYRVTHEVPLPYTFDHAPQDDSDDDEDDKGQGRGQEEEAAQSSTPPNRDSFVAHSIDRPASVRLASIPAQHDQSEDV
ncbi:hypothetical protein FRB97_005453 [Tulasnella sp. 331]|nr:hypothetical protein FRB97_005453 [Tulasnella sp. 331]